MLFPFLVLCGLFVAQASPFVDPLPSALIEPFSTSIRCPPTKQFKWTRSDTSGLDIVFYYTCGQDEEMSQTLHCTNGYKAQYRKDLIPDAMRKAAIPMAMKKGFITGLDQEPSFGLFSTGPDYSTKNGAVVVFACLNPNK
ncbi:uncharacterized protein LOC110065276 [Orbicella faveolata]|uniref:uncharacterized protein LOC110065276 n=1 Tax=Orbicella faveolata TaxID=48498 RepID=UPI0009E36C58|nr:uncharacterized protein LOC110065276 [Orbicella faveolata]